MTYNCFEKKIDICKLHTSFRPNPGLDPIPLRPNPEFRWLVLLKYMSVSLVRVGVAEKVGQGGHVVRQGGAVPRLQRLALTPTNQI